MGVQMLLEASACQKIALKEILSLAKVIVSSMC